MTYAAGQFLAVGENTTILTSPDGINWTSHSSGNWVLNDVIRAQGLYVAVGGNSQGSVVLTSPDAQTWTLRLFAAGTGFSTIAFDGAKFVVIQNQLIWTSTDAQTWQQITSSAPYGSTAIYYAEGHWVISLNPQYASGGLFASSNLVIWSQSTSNTAVISGIASANGLTVASLVDGTLLNSTDAWNWTGTPVALLPTYPRDLAYVNGTFVCVGEQQIAFSADGVNWTNLVNPTNIGNLITITYGDGRYVAGSEYRTVWTSLDGVDWTNPAPNLSISPYVSDVHVAFGNGVFVGAAGYEGDILTSPDGLNWTVQQIGTNAGNYIYFYDIKFGGGRFVTVGSGAIATSLDGTNWLFQLNNYSPSQVACGNGTFVAVGYSGAVTSQDGTNWTPTLSGTLNDVAFADGFFVAIGSGTQTAGLSTESPIWISADGFNWTLKHSNTPLGLSMIAFGDSTFEILGANNLLLQSDPFVQLAIGFQLSPQISISGPTNRTYRIDYAATLSGNPNWQTLTNVCTTNGATVGDLSYTNASSRFYRAVLLP